MNLKNYGLSGLVAQIENDEELRSDIITLIDISETNINILKDNEVEKVIEVKNTLEVPVKAIKKESRTIKKR